MSDFKSQFYEVFLDAKADGAHPESWVAGHWAAREITARSDPASSNLVDRALAGGVPPVFGMPVEESLEVPEDEVRLVSNGKVLGTIRLKGYRP